MNRSLPLVLLAFTVLGLGLWLGLGGARPTLLGGPGSLDPSQLAGSTYEDGPQGSSDLFRMLGRTRDRVERWSRPLGEVPPGGTLVVISPATTMLLEEQRQLLLHAEAGGTVLLVVDELPELLQDRGLEMRQVPLPASSRPQIPSPLVDPAAPLESRGMGLLHPGTGVLSLYGSSHGARVASVALGQGRLLVVTDPFVLSNQGIRRDGNLRFAWRLSNNLPEPIRFDERHHGFEPQRGAWAYARSRGLAPGLLIALALALLTLWRLATRLEPPPPTLPRRPEGAVALVAPLAQRLAAADAAEPLIPTLEAEARRRGLDPDAIEADTARRRLLALARSLDLSPS